MIQRLRVQIQRQGEFLKFLKLLVQIGNKQWQIQDFLLGGTEPLGGADLWRGHFLVKTCAKTKELDPIGGGGAGSDPLDPPMISFNWEITLM